MERIKQSVEDLLPDREIELNEFVSAEFMENGDLWIHVQSRHDQTLVDKLKLLKEAFFKLADALTTDERYQSVKRIVGSSWIVAEHPRIMRELGFDIAESNEGFEVEEEKYAERKKERGGDFTEKPHAHAYIDTERFVELYG